jgi:hypothetical protein
MASTSWGIGGSKRVGETNHFLPRNQQHPLTKATAGIVSKGIPNSRQGDKDPEYLQSRPGQDMTSTAGMAYAIRVHLLQSFKKKKNAGPQGYMQILGPLVEKLNQKWYNHTRGG